MPIKSVAGLDLKSTFLNFRLVLLQKEKVEENGEEFALFGLKKGKETLPGRMAYRRSGML